MLNIKNLCVSVEGKKILHNINLTVGSGEIHALMGPNGSGKSTLALTLMGSPRCEVDKGVVSFKGKNLLALSVDERARLGLFLAFQYPYEISGVNLFNFLRRSYTFISGTAMSISDFQKHVDAKLKLLSMDNALLMRNINEGFSGGEKKKAEILQLAILEPKLAILDETDSGLDVDALKTIGKGINNLINHKMGVIIITHYHRMLHYIEPDFVHVMFNGEIVASGGSKLARAVEKKGYEWL